MMLGSASLGVVLIPLLFQVGGSHSIRGHNPWVLLSEKEGSQGEKGQERMVGCLPSTAETWCLIKEGTGRHHSVHREAESPLRLVMVSFKERTQNQLY